MVQALLPLCGNAGRGNSAAGCHRAAYLEGKLRYIAGNGNRYRTVYAAVYPADDFHQLRLDG
ncbi:hypothetical protein D3C79_1054810 [compost metagenome]